MSWILEHEEVGRMVAKASRRIEKGRPNLFDWPSCDRMLARFALESSHIVDGAMITLYVPVELAPGPVAVTKSAGLIASSALGRSEKGD